MKKINKSIKKRKEFILQVFQVHRDWNRINSTESSSLGNYTIQRKGNQPSLEDFDSSTGPLVLLLPVIPGFEGAEGNSNGDADKRSRSL